MNPKVMPSWRSGVLCLVLIWLLVGCENDSQPMMQQLAEQFQEHRSEFYELNILMQGLGPEATIRGVRVASWPYGPKNTPKVYFMNSDRDLPFSEAHGILKSLLHQQDLSRVLDLLQKVKAEVIWLRKDRSVVVGINESPFAYFHPNSMEGLDDYLSGALLISSEPRWYVFQPS